MRPISMDGTCVGVRYYSSCFFFVCFFKPYLRMPISPTLVKCLRKDNLPLITAVCCQPTRQLSSMDGTCVGVRYYSSCFFFVCFFKPYLRMPISPTLVKCLRKDNLPLITAVCCQPTRQLSFVCALPHAHYGMLHHVM